MQSTTTGGRRGRLAFAGLSRSTEVSGPEPLGPPPPSAATAKRPPSLSVCGKENYLFICSVCNHNIQDHPISSENSSLLAGTPVIMAHSSPPCALLSLTIASVC